MRLTTKHVGGIFDVRGGDGSWSYKLLDIKKGELLFMSSSGRYEIESQTANDWREFGFPFKKADIKKGWKIGRRIK